MCFEKCCCWGEALAGSFRRGTAARCVSLPSSGTVEAAELSPCRERAPAAGSVVSRSTCAVQRLASVECFLAKVLGELE